MTIRELIDRRDVLVRLNEYIMARWTISDDFGNEHEVTDDEDIASIIPTLVVAEIERITTQIECRARGV